MSKPISVMAEIQNTVTDFSPDDTGIAIYRFGNGAMAVLLNASVTLAGENTTEIYGDQGVLIQNQDDAPSTNVPLPSAATALKLYARTHPTWQDLNVPIPDDHGERIAGVPRAFADCLKYDRDPDITAEDGRILVEMILAAYQSAREGRRVTFPLHDAGYREVGGSGIAPPNNQHKTANNKPLSYPHHKGRHFRHEQSPTHTRNPQLRILRPHAHRPLRLLA